MMSPAGVGIFRGLVGSGIHGASIPSMVVGSSNEYCQLLLIQRGLLVGMC